MSKKYFMKVAIDFGSTNTVMAWRMYDRTDDGKLIISQKYNSENSAIKIPSVMIFADENPGNEAVKTDLFGEEATKVIEHSNTPPVVCDNFKQYLYTYKPDTEEYEKGKELCTKFFKHLRSVYKQKIINTIPDFVLSDMDVTVFLSTPVRAHPTHRSVMRKIALDAGFTADNLVTEINTDYDEATCVVRYAIANRKDAMKKIFAKAGAERGALLLFADSGGSTFDTCIKRFRIKDDGVIHMDSISEWPSPDVKYPLGGCLIDEAIRDYLIAEGYADKEFTLSKWESVDGKLRFRKFKEENNQTIEAGEIATLGNVKNVCYDYDDDIRPEKNYNKSPNKINAKIYEEKICAEFISKFKESLKELFATQRETEYGEVKPADIDGIFLFGAGSKLYFIPRLLLEDFDDKTPGFVKIQKNKDLLFEGWDDPSTCCALGALTEDENIEMPNYSKDKYFVSVQIYVHGKLIEQELKKGTIELSSENKVYEIGSSKETCVCVMDKILRISEKHQLLPYISSYKDLIEYNDNLEDCITVKVVLKKLKENGEYETISEPYIYTTQRVLTDKLVKVAKMAFALIGVIPIVGTIPIDWALKTLGGKGELTRGYAERLEEMVFPTRKIQLSLNMRFTLTEHNSISVDTRIESDNFKTSEESYSFNI